MTHSRISESWLFLLSMVPGEYSTYSCSLAGKKKKQERTLAWGKNRCLKQAADGKRRAQELAMPRLAAIKGVKTGGKPIRVVRRVRRLGFFFFSLFLSGTIRDRNYWVGHGFLRLLSLQELKLSLLKPLEIPNYIYLKNKQEQS